MIARPKNMMDAIWLARLHEDKMNDQYKSFKPYNSPFSVSSTPLQFSKPINSSSTSVTTDPSSKPTLPIKRLSPHEMQLHRDKGLCFN